MRTRNISHPEKNIIKGTYTASTTVVPDLKLVNVFRYNTTEDITIANPKNLSDGEYIRIEVASITSKAVNFGSKYNVNGSQISDGSHDSDLIVIYEGWYNADSDSINMMIFGGGVSTNSLLNEDGTPLLNEDGSYLLKED